MPKSIYRRGTVVHIILSTEEADSLATILHEIAIDTDIDVDEQAFDLMTMISEGIDNVDD